MSLQASMTLRVGDFRMDIDLRADVGELVVVVGPNGAGKTTLLRALAGLVPIESGTVLLDGEVLNNGTGFAVPPDRRPVGVVFQDYLLFPHLSVLENIAFGLRARGMHRKEARQRAATWVERMDLSGLADRKPRTLSGGQAQRVALARALATDPRLLLLDEPLAALDAAIRAQVRRDLRRYLESFEGARLLVTHDPLEAIALADRIVVMEAGRIVQAGTVAEITAQPRSRYVAQLVGLNLFHGHAHGDHVVLPGGTQLAVAGAGAGPVFAVVHPHAVSLHREFPEGTARNVWKGQLGSLDYEGDRVRVEVTGDLPVVAEVTPAATSELRLAEGGSVWVSVKATEIDVYPE